MFIKTWKPRDELPNPRVRGVRKPLKPVYEATEQLTRGTTLSGYPRSLNRLVPQTTTLCKILHTVVNKYIVV